MEALDTQSKHVPYRNSKLTYLLQDALGGNSRTMLIVTLAPGENSADESLACLQFASRVRSIVPTGGRALRNVDAKNIEESLKKSKQDLRLERQRRIKEEEKANLLQKSLRTAEEKVLASIEYRAKGISEAKRSAESQLQALTASVEDWKGR